MICSNRLVLSIANIVFLEGHAVLRRVSQKNYSDELPRHFGATPNNRTLPDPAESRNCATSFIFSESSY
jgi:hypothetical protein